MKLFCHDVLASTSETAAEMVADSPDLLPFVVLAKKQTNGRGRLGRTWASPKGNLYFTVAISSSEIPAFTQKRGLPVSLCVALSLKKTLKQLWNVSVKIKWPNDLYYDGSKLGGILCESIQSASDASPYLLIGVGLNLSNAPSLEDQSTTSIAQASRKILDSEFQQLASNLVEDIYASVTSEPHSIEYFEAESMLKGQLWLDRQGLPFLAQGVDQLGGLRLAPLKTDGVALKSEQIIYSADHDFTFAYQRRSGCSPLLLADVGNSFLKINLYRHAFDEVPAASLRASYEPESWEEQGLWQQMRGWQQEFAIPAGWPVYCGSVNQRGLKSLEPGFARHGWVLQAIAARPIHVDYQRYALQKMGIDRLALCEAASVIKPHGAKILLSAGTCLTLDVMSPKNEHLGGFIMPGFAMSLGAMHCNTDALPKLNSSLLIKQLQQSGDLHFGLNTEDAMVQGFFWQVTGMVEVIQKQLFADYGEKAEILVTGGYGEILAKFLKAGYDPDLIMRGLKNLVLF